MADGKKKKGPKKSIQIKILAPFLLLIMLAGGVIAFVSYNTSAKTTEKELTTNMESQMASMNDTFELFFYNMDSTLDRLASNKLLTAYQKENDDALLQYLEETGDENDTIQNVYAGIEDTSDVIIYPEADLGDDFDPKERSWYTEAVEAEGSVIWTEPYVDEASGETVVTAAQASYDEDDELKGVMGADVFVDTLLAIVDNVEIGDSGYALLLDESGTYLAHPNEDLVGKDGAEEAFFQEIADGEDQGVVHDQANGEDKIMAFAKNPTTDCYYRRRCSASGRCRR